MYDQIDIEKNKILSDSVMRYFVAEVSICRNLQYDLEKMLAKIKENPDNVFSITTLDSKGPIQKNIAANIIQKL